MSDWGNGLLQEGGEVEVPAMTKIEFEKWVIRLRKAETALQETIRDTGGYTGGMPQKYCDEYGLEYGDE